MKQHFVEDFCSSQFDSFRWGFGYQDSTTGNSAAMGDGGLIMTTGTSATNQALYISFMSGSDTDGSNNGTVTVIPFRPFAHDGSAMIAVWRQHSITVGRWNGGGLAKDGRGDVAGTNMAYAYGGAAVTNFQMRTADNAGNQTEVDSGMVQNTDFNAHKVECKSSSVDYTINGVFRGTSTGYLPTVKLAPIFNTHRSGCVMSIRYCEAWNT